MQVCNLCPTSLASISPPYIIGSSPAAGEKVKVVEVQRLVVYLGEMRGDWQQRDAGSLFWSPRLLYISTRSTDFVGVQELMWR